MQRFEAQIALLQENTGKAHDAAVFERRIDELELQLRKCQEELHSKSEIEAAFGKLKVEHQLVSEKSQALQDDLKDQESYMEQVKRLEAETLDLQQKNIDLEIIKGQLLHDNETLTSHNEDLSKSIIALKTQLNIASKVDSECIRPNPQARIAEVLGAELDQVKHEKGQLTRIAFALQSQLDAAHENTSRLIEVALRDRQSNAEIPVETQPSDDESSLSGSEVTENVAAFIGIRKEMEELIGELASGFPLEDGADTMSEVVKWADEEEEEDSNENRSVDV
jgi:hypothetical protein